MRIITRTFEDIESSILENRNQAIKKANQCFATLFEFNSKDKVLNFNGENSLEVINKNVLDVLNFFNRKRSLFNDEVKRSMTCKYEFIQNTMNNFNKAETLKEAGMSLVVLKDDLYSFFNDAEKHLRGK